MPADDELQGMQLQLDIENKAVTYDGLVDIGFTRNFASSQAYRAQFANNPDIIPADAKDGLDFEKSTLKNERGESVYSWLGFEAHALLFDFLKRAEADDERRWTSWHTTSMNATSSRQSNRSGRGCARPSMTPRATTIRTTPDSTESRSADRFIAAGGQVKRIHFHNLQHNTVCITRRNGIPETVLCGSTNFTYRGLYIQANNMLVFRSPDLAALYGQMFDLAFASPSTFRDTDFAKTWYVVTKTDR
jgi:hypothetical protein